MRKLFALSAVFLILSCAKEKPESTILSGRISGVENSNISIEGNSFKREIKLNEDGSFEDTLDIQYDGLYQIEELPVYLHKGKHLNLEVDFKDIKNTSFGGDLAVENNYLLEKLKIYNSTSQEELIKLWTKEEADFVSEVDEISNKYNQLLEKTNFDIDSFKEREIKNLKYSRDFLLSSYEAYHPRLVQAKDFKVSENFPKIYDTIDLDNAGDFDFSLFYRYLVSKNFSEKIYKEIENDQDEGKYFSLGINNIKKLKSQNIRNDLVSKLVYFISASNNNVEADYNELLSISTDENFKTKLTQKYNKIKTLLKGNPSPEFNYPNHKGGNTALEDLKGKYVYIDVWATWCGPCVQQIPFLKQLEEKYKDKKIEFVSISIDAKKDYEKWKKFVDDKKLGGIQLIADKDWKSEFVQNYAIDGIPRFILLDPQGNIVNANAPRPSERKLIELFDELGI